MAGENSSHVLQFLQHPELLSWGREAIHNFLRKRERYELQVAEANNNGNSNLHLTSIKASFDPYLLANMLLFNKFSDGLTTETITDAIIKKALLETRGGDDLTADKLQKKIKARVHCNMREPDPSLRIEALDSDYMTFLRKLNVISLVKDSPKLATEHLVELVKPPALQQLLTSEREFKHRDLRKDVLGVLGHTKSRATNFEIYNKDFIKDSSKKNFNGSGGNSSNGSGSGGNGSGGNGSGGPGGNGSGGTKGNGAPPKKTNNKSNDFDFDLPRKGQDLKEQNKNQAPKCLNP